VKVLCFGFELEIVLIIQDVSVIAEQCLCSVQASSVPHTALPASGLGVQRSWEGTQLGQLTPPDQRDVPCCMTSVQQ